MDSLTNQDAPRRATTTPVRLICGTISAHSLGPIFGGHPPTDVGAKHRAVYGFHSRSTTALSQPRSTQVELCSADELCTASVQQAVGRLQDGNIHYLLSTLVFLVSVPSALLLHVFPRRSLHIFLFCDV